MNGASINRNAYLWSVIVLFISLPYTIRVNTNLIIICCFLWLISSSMSDKIVRFKQNFKILVFFLGYFLLHIVGMLWTSSLGTGLRVIEKNGGMLAIPLILLTGPLFSIQEIRKVKYVFILTCLIFSFINLAHAGFRYSFSNDIQEFFYYNLAKTFEFHPIYLSIYYLLGIMLLFSFWKGFSVQKKIFGAVAILFLEVSIVLLESKTVIATSLLLAGAAVFYFVWIRFRSLIAPSLIVLAVLVISCFVLVNFNTRFKEINSIKSLSILKEDRMTDFTMINGLTLRLILWKFSMVEFKSANIILGLGTGDVQEFLDSTYEKHNMAISYDDQVLGYYGYDIHNEFLDIFLRFGLLGLLIFIGMIWTLIKRFTSLKMVIATGFIFILLVSFLTETFLGLNKGIVFFSLFASVFWLESENYLVIDENSNFRNEGYSE